jgi:hypothetical protein
MVRLHPVKKKWVNVSLKPFEWEDVFETHLFFILQFNSVLSLTVIHFSYYNLFLTYTPKFYLNLVKS